MKKLVVIEKRFKDPFDNFGNKNVMIPDDDEEMLEELKNVENLDIFEKNN
mgnify:CR=1 FL=1